MRNAALKSKQITAVRQLSHSVDQLSPSLSLLSKMTGRHRTNTNSKIETAIEACRSEGKWKRVIELAEELKTHATFGELASQHYPKTLSGPFF